MQRLFAAILVGAAVLAGLPAQAQAPAPPPPFATTKVEGTDNVYIFRALGAQSMFVVTPEGVIATDPIGYARRDASAMYLQEIRKITDKPVKYVVYSHHHYDHIAGGKPFKDQGAIFVSHQRAKERLEQLGDPHTVIPDQTFKSLRTITLGGTTLELRYLGLNHSDSTIVMRLPKEKIVFAVDFVSAGTMPGRGMIDSYPIEWEDSLKRLLAMDWERMIPGHPAPGGRLGTKKDVQDVLGILQEASAEVKKQALDGKCWDAAERDTKLDKYKDLPGYEVGLPMVLRRYCGLWGRGT
jgi:glyoxylase-like metal-dependent hydrolase (beta-lactamase superfamily II)